MLTHYLNTATFMHKGCLHWYRGWIMVDYYTVNIPVEDRSAYLEAKDKLEEDLGIELTAGQAASYLCKYYLDNESDA